jgi:hypothetical protein
MTSERPATGATVLLDAEEISAAVAGATALRRAFRLEGLAAGTVELSADGRLLCDVYRLFPRPVHLRGWLPDHGPQALQFVWHRTGVALFMGDTMLCGVDAMREEATDFTKLLAPFVQTLGADWIAAAETPAEHPFVRLHREIAVRHPDEAVRLVALPPILALRGAFERALTLEGFETLQPRLRHPSEWPDATAEIVLAGHLAQRAASVRFVPTLGGGAGRSPDLRLTTPAGTELVAEVKRIQHGSAKHAKQSARWPTFFDRCRKATKRAPFSFYFVFRRAPDANLEGEATGALASVDVSSLTALWAHVRVDPAFDLWACRLPPGTQACGPPGIADPDRAFFQVRAETNGIQMRSVLLEGAELDAPAFTAATFAKRVADAMGQLPESGPSILGIEIPWYRRPDDVKTHFEWLRAEASKGHFGRVNRFYVFWLDEEPVHRVVDGEPFTNPAGARYVFMHLDHPRPKTPIELWRA